ncbi:cytochrome P450 [Streptomyces sp. DSM 44917]|uniref:Cytochrome P450 n=1 Tax=Streptomyces boetiae TaxID=3075541 RepID=A0ABU2LDY5_9ACTN|nr:cytochrome P450 [Streptomyces sp. DSM 44917]MDT0309701.1 cytochrome P450 [Streptomyces sp. DSM 44917]
MATTLRTPARRWPELDRIPHPRYRVPVLGDVIGASLSTPVQDTMRLARELGPIYRRKIFGAEIVFVSGGELVAELSDESRFLKYVTMAVQSLRLVGGDGLFTAYGNEPNWQRAHDILAPAFTRESMVRYHPTMLAMAHRLMGVWDGHAQRGSAADVPGDMTKLTLETIAHTGFGYDFGSFERSEPHPFVTAMVAGLTSVLQLRVATLPLIGQRLARRKLESFSAHSEFLNATVDRVIRERVDSGDSRTDDLLGLMLNTEQPGTGERLDPVNIRYQVITFLVAGHETTSGALSFALYYLAKHPEIQARAREEVDRVWGPDGDPTYEQVSKLRYVRRVLDEALRLWPTAPAYTRAARADTVLGGRYPMRKGASALVLVPALHRDKEVWGQDVERFDPDRFLPERVRARPAHTFKPFGTGERACIGRQFALHEATLVLGLLLRRYELHDHADYRLKIAERLTLMPEDFTLTLTRRSPRRPAEGPDRDHAPGPGDTGEDTAGEGPAEAAPTGCPVHHG